VGIIQGTGKVPSLADPSAVAAAIVAFSSTLVFSTAPAKPPHDSVAATVGNIAEWMKMPDIVRVATMREQRSLLDTAAKVNALADETRSLPDFVRWAAKLLEAFRSQAPERFAALAQKWKAVADQALDAARTTPDSPTPQAWWNEVEQHVATIADMSEANIKAMTIAESLAWCQRTPAKTLNRGLAVLKELNDLGEMALKIADEVLDAQGAGTNDLPSRASQASNDLVTAVAHIEAALKDANA
jgi:hypothetical protein